ncbi:IS3 family transposase [Enterocloster clostridioformis]
MQLNRLIDITYTKHPEFGHRRIAAWLGTYYGFQVERKTVLARMQEMGIQAIYPRQSTSRRDPSHKVYPYLLKDVSAAYPDHVWSIVITYIPIQKSWLYLTAIIDWYSRYVMAWETGCLISMDHRGRAYDNIFIERFWRSLKYEDIYLKDYQYPREARKGTFFGHEPAYHFLGNGDSFTDEQGVYPAVSVTPAVFIKQSENLFADVGILVLPLSFGFLVIIAALGQAKLPQQQRQWVFIFKSINDHCLLPVFEGLRVDAGVFFLTH